MLETGTFVGGRYEILGEIGSGGMSNVYKAMDHKLNRSVAVKVLKQEYCEDTTFIKKFQTEAQAAAVLTHPNIVNVFDVGEDSGIYYIVMELVEGITLKNYISKKGKLSVKEATSIAIQVSMGLEAAHSHGIVHRDVKPQNIIISTDGKVKVTDFGIARAASTNTISSNVMGSVHYSSPEQVRGGYSDAKSDIYSLGVTMYEMVTGHVPFDGDTTVSIAIKHLQDEVVPPSYYTPDLPHSLEQIILKCMQKSVDKRYNNIEDTIADLKHSLINPDGDFVQLNTSDPTEQTTVFDENEMQQIKDGRNQTQSDTPEEDSSYMMDDDDDEENDGIHHGLERAMMIGGFVIGAVIIVVLVIFIINVTGLFNFSDVGQEDESVVADEDLVEVPDLCGLTEDEAVELAGEYGIGIQWNGEETSETYAAGLISSQEIEAGTEVERYTTVKYKLSTGVASVVVPSVVGYDETSAEQTLTNMGFEVTVNKSYGTDEDEGTVLSQSPASGSEAQAGDTMTIEVSMGSEYSGFAVPNVIGATEGEAKNELAPLIVTVQSTPSSDEEAGTVIAQSVAEGVWVDKGTDITLTVGAGSGNSTTEETTASGTGVWKCTQQLDTPTGYTGGLIKLELVQTVNGSPQATTIVDGEQLEFPYQLDLTGAEGVTEGTLYLSELINGEYVDLGHYTITFEEVSE